MTRRMIDNVNVVQAFLPGGSSLVELRRQKGRRSALLAKLFSDRKFQTFFFTEQKSVLLWVCWSAKFHIGIQTFFTEQRSVIACVCWSASSFRSEFKLFFTEQKSVLAWVCWSASTWQWRRSWETLRSSCLCRLVGEWQLPSQVSISADPFEKSTQISS